MPGCLFHTPDLPGGPDCRAATTARTGCADLQILPRRVRTPQDAMLARWLTASSSQVVERSCRCPVERSSLVRAHWS